MVSRGKSFGETGELLECDTNIRMHSNDTNNTNSLKLEILNYGLEFIRIKPSFAEGFGRVVRRSAVAERRTKKGELSLSPID